jgi:hypothetical protein
LHTAGCSLFFVAAIVPGSHLKVKEIEARRAQNWEVVEKADGSGKERRWIGPARPEEDMGQYTELGLTPCVTNVIAGDLVLCKQEKRSVLLPVDR